MTLSGVQKSKYLADKAISDELIAGKADLTDPRFRATQAYHTAYPPVNYSNVSGDQSIGTSQLIPPAALSTNTFLRYNFDCTIDTASAQNPSGAFILRHRVNGATGTLLSGNNLSTSQTSGFAAGQACGVEGHIAVLATGVGGQLLLAQTRWARSAAGAALPVSYDQVVVSVDLSSGLQIFHQINIATASASNAFHVLGGNLEHVR